MTLIMLQLYFIISPQPIVIRNKTYNSPALNENTNDVTKQTNPRRYVQFLWGFRVNTRLQGEY